MAKKEDEDKEAQQGFKIVDRRRFDTEGNVKEGGTARAEQPPEKLIKGKSESRPRMDDTGVPEITFSSFVMSLATQALMQLGEIKPPPGLDVPVDINGARQTIEILSMMGEKTKGNLDRQEEDLIEEILHELRIKFVAHSKS